MGYEELREKIISGKAQVTPYQGNEPVVSEEEFETAKEKIGRLIGLESMAISDAEDATNCGKLNVNARRSLELAILMHGKRKIHPQLPDYLKFFTPAFP